MRPDAAGMNRTWNSTISAGRREQPCHRNPRAADPLGALDGERRAPRWGLPDRSAIYRLRIAGPFPPQETARQRGTADEKQNEKARNPDRRGGGPERNEGLIAEIDHVCIARIVMMSTVRMHVLIMALLFDTQMRMLAA